MFAEEIRQAQEIMGENFTGFLDVEVSFAKESEQQPSDSYRLLIRYENGLPVDYPGIELSSRGDVSESFMIGLMTLVMILVIEKPKELLADHPNDLQRSQKVQLIYGRTRQDFLRILEDEKPLLERRDERFIVTSPSFLEERTLMDLTYLLSKAGR